MLQMHKLKIGDSFSERVVENLTRTQIVQYAGASGDYNPIHTDEIFATQVAGFKSVISHGMLTMGLTAKLLTNLVGDGRLKKYGLRFTDQVLPGDTLDVTASVIEIGEEEGKPLVEFEVKTTNQHGVVVAKGTAAANIDP